jgi:RNA polymerase sigma-70 factor (ECF subfamily)
MGSPHESLIGRCKAGNPRAQHELYRLLAPRMYAVCYRYAKNEMEAEDILQESFVKVFQKIATYDERGALEGWVRRIVVNTAIDHLRSQRRRLEAPAPELPSGEEVEPEALDQLQTELLLRLIRELPEGYRVVFNLYALEGYSHAEIAQRLDITESTSRSQYARARGWLIDKIRGLYPQANVHRDAI